MRDIDFEVLEEAFQSLTAKVQKALGKEELHQSGQKQHSGSLPNESSFTKKEGRVVAETATSNQPIASGKSPPNGISKLLNQCQTVFRRLQVEAKQDADFQGRLELYQIQLDALIQHYQEANPDADIPNRTPAKNQDPTIEITFRFADDGQDWKLS